MEPCVLILRSSLGGRGVDDDLIVPPSFPESRLRDFSQLSQVYFRVFADMSLLPTPLISCHRQEILENEPRGEHHVCHGS